MRALVLVALIGCAGPLHASELDVTAPDGLTCHVYIVADTAPIREVVLWMGGTGTGSSAFVPDDLHRPNVALVSFDKPGVRAPFGDPKSVRITDAIFLRHTQGTLLACARHALDRAVERFGDVRIVLRGHSEGSLIALAVYASLERDVARRVRALVLSGLPVESFGELLRRQLADRPVLARAVADCDWPVMKRFAGVSCAYLADAETRPSVRAVMEQLAARGATVEIDVLAGVDDTLTPVRFVRELDAWNRASGHLDLHVYEYAGAHSASADGHRALIDVMDRVSRYQ